MDVGQERFLACDPGSIFDIVEPIADRLGADRDGFGFLELSSDLDRGEPSIGVDHRSDRFIDLRRCLSSSTSTVQIEHRMHRPLFVDDGLDRRSTVARCAADSAVRKPLMMKIDQK